MANAELLDIWIPEDGNIDTLTGNYEQVDVPQLSGASGGGVWKSNARPNPEQWTVEKMVLAGLHTGSVRRWKIGDTEHIFCREILIGHALQQIALDFPDVQERMHHEWPDLRAYAVQS